MTSNSRIAEALAAFGRNDLDRARSLAEAQIDEEPGAPDVEHLLGLIDCRAGNIDSGIRHLHAALALQPGNVAFRVMLARALVDSGQSGEALAIAIPPQGISPAEIALWHVRAEAAQATSDYGVAEQAWKILCAARPDDWRAWANYGDALAALEHWTDAANALRRAWMLNPDEQPLREKFATALARAGFFNEAADHLKAMLDAGPDDRRIRLTLARLLADLGRNEEAVHQLGKAAETAVGSTISVAGGKGLIRIAVGDRTDLCGIGSVEVASIRELAMLLERTNQTAALRALLADAASLGVSQDELAYPAASLALRDGNAIEAKRLLKLGDPNLDPVRHNGLMAKIADRLGEPVAAFEAAQAMHDAVPDHDSWQRRGAEYRRHLRSVAAALTPEWAARLHPPSPARRTPPAFLVGFPRSGTTLLDTFLMGHPDVQMLEEFQMLNAAGGAIGSIADLPNRRPQDFERARAAYFAELDRHLDPRAGAFVIDKLPLNMLGLVLIRTLFPDAPVIFAQRHPCDVVLSGFIQSFVMNEAMACFLKLEDAADLYDTALGLWTRSLALFPKRTRTSVYEELIDDPEASLRALLEFLGLDWRPELLDHRTTAKARGAISTPSYDQVVQPLSKAPSGRWRRYERQLEPVLPVLLPWAERLGYAEF